MGGVHGLSDQEIRKATAYNLRPAPMERAWDLWAMRLAIKEGRAVPAAAAGAPAPRKAKAATGPAKVPVRKAPVRKAPARKAAAKARRKSPRAR
jgi:hypothetical protein